MGDFGPKSDGVDGKLGKLTKKAFEKEFKTNDEFKKKYGHLLGFDTDETSSEEETSDSSEYSGGESTSSNDVILLGGLDYRKDDLKIDEQKKLLIKGLKKSMNVHAFKYDDPNSALLALDEFPNAKVVLFSAGTGYTNKFAKKIKNINNLYVLEPYPKAKGSIQSAITDYDLPLGNIILGRGPGSGLGMFTGTKTTPKGYSHFGSLEYAGSVIS